MVESTQSSAIFEFTEGYAVSKDALVDLKQKVN